MIKKTCTSLLLIGVIAVLVSLYLKNIVIQVPDVVENRIHEETYPQSPNNEKVNDISDVSVNHPAGDERAYDEDELIAQLKSGDFSSLIGDKPASPDSVKRMYENIK